MTAINVSPSPLHIGRFKLFPGDGLPGLPLTAEEEADVERLVRKGLLARPGPQAIAPESGETAPSKSAPKSDNKSEKGKDKPDKAGDKPHGADA